MLDRRHLLSGALSLAAARFLTPLGARGEARPLVGDPFALGVASGDPTTDGFVLWTRLIGVSGDTETAYEIATDAGFRRIIRAGRARAAASRGHCVHVETAGLVAGRTYFYRFHYRGVVSRTGQVATVPSDPARLRIALSSCQHWEQGWFTAYRDIVAERPDLVLQVGDYIYEKSFGGGPDVRRFGAPDPITLIDYRARHALYRTDPDLQTAHAALPFAVTWDDHEVENDYAGGQGVATHDPAAFVRRRAAAYQAYFEHMPLRPSRLGCLYRRLHWGRLATLHILDTRRYRSPQPCGRGGHVIDKCAAATDPRATMLGDAQEAWLTDGLGIEQAHWSLVAQGTLFARLHLPSSPTARWSDIWDGYSAPRARLLKRLTIPSVRNAVVLGGDVHSVWFNDLHRDVENSADRW